MDNIIKLIDFRLFELSNENYEYEKELDFLGKYMEYYVLDLKNIKRFHRLNTPPFLAALLIVNTDLTFQEIDDLITPIEPIIEKLPCEDIFCRALVVVSEILYDLGYDEMLKTGCDVPPFNDKKFLDFILKINNRDVFRYFASFLQVKGMCENIYYMSNNNDMEYKLLLKEIKQSPLYNDLFKYCYDNTQRKVKELKKKKRDFLKRKQKLIDLYKQLKNYVNTNNYIEYLDYFDDLEDDFKLFLFREMLLHNKVFYDKAQNDISMIDNNIEAIFKINGFDFNHIGKENQNRLNNGNVDNIKQLLKVINSSPFYISDNTIIVTIPINKELLEKVDKPNYEIELSETEQKVYNCISENENITISELSDKVSIGDRQVMRVLNSLKDKNIIKREGSNKNGVWKIIEK